MLALNYGFTIMFSIASVIFAISVVLIALMLPSVTRIEQPVDTLLAQVNGYVRMLFYRLHVDVDWQYYVHH